MGEDAPEPRAIQVRAADGADGPVVVLGESAEAAWPPVTLVSGEVLATIRAEHPEWAWSNGPLLEFDVDNGRARYREVVHHERESVHRFERVDEPEHAPELGEVAGPRD